jgi:hypothetical protein
VNVCRLPLVYPLCSSPLRHWDQSRSGARTLLRRAPPTPDLTVPAVFSCEPCRTPEGRTCVGPPAFAGAYGGHRAGSVGSLVSFGVARPPG